MSDDLLNVEFNDGKYIIIQKKDGSVHACRYGDYWYDLTGNNMVLALAQEVERLREKDKVVAEQLKYINDILNVDINPLFTKQAGDGNG